MDGDMTSIRGLYTDEANNEAEKIMNSKFSALTVNGSNIRTVSKEILNSFYELTKIGINPVDVNQHYHDLYLSYNPDDFTRLQIIKMISDTADMSKIANRKIKARHNTWDKFIIPKDYFYKDQPTIQTTVGRFLFNKYILQGANIIQHTKYINKIINKAGLSDIDQLVGSLYRNDIIDRGQFNKYIDRRDNLGYWINGMLTHTISPAMCKPLPEVEKRKKELVKQYEKEIANRDIVVMKKIEDELVSLAKELLKNDPGMDLYDSGDLKFGDNYKNNSIIKGPILNKLDNKFDFIQTAHMDGLEIKDFPAHANSIVSGAYPSAIATAAIGYEGKQLLALMQTLEVDEKGTDCGSTKLVPITICDFNKKDHIDSYIVDNGKLVLLNENNIESYVGKRVMFRSPMTCRTQKICNICMGELFYKLGTKYAGLSSVQMSHTNLNLALKSKHVSTIQLTSLQPEELLIDA